MSVTQWKAEAMIWTIVIIVLVVLAVLFVLGRLRGGRGV
jgi:hypothetical protein